MQIKVARALGFCFGVRRAIQMVEAATDEEGRIDSLGSVVHNPDVVRRLDRRGVSVVGDLGQARSRAVAITAHGVGPEVLAAAAREHRVVDTTCPIVAKAQRAARTLANAGFPLVIYGEESHPEVRGVLAWSKRKGVAVLDPTAPVELRKRKVALMAQTTKSQQSFARFIGEFLAHNLGHLNEVRIVNTTCPETEDRYHAARELAAEADLMIVIGGRNSANTRKLAETCAACGVETHHVETVNDLDPAWIEGKEVVGITAGASTPDESIQAVAARLMELDRNRAERTVRAHA